MAKVAAGWESYIKKRPRMEALSIGHVSLWRDGIHIRRQLAELRSVDEEQADHFGDGSDAP